MCKSLQCWEPTLGQKADSSGRTALHYAAASGKTEVVKLLLVNSLLAYIADDDGLYPVHYAAMGGYSEIIREIMKICPSCDELVDKKRRSILHYAVKFGRAKVVWYICRNPKFKSIMNAGDSEGNTPIHLAVKHGHLFSFFLLMMDLRVNLGLFNHKGLAPIDIAFNEYTHNYSFPVFWNLFMGFSLLLCKAYSSPSNLARNLRYIHCLEDDKESSRYFDMSQSMLCFSLFIAAGSFAAAFTPPGDYSTEREDAGMPLLDGQSPFLSYVEANSVSFCYSAIATYMLVHASLPTTPIRSRRCCLRVSAAMIFVAVTFMFATFANVVWLALDPRKSWRECLLVYSLLVVEPLMVYISFILPLSVLAIPACFRVSMRLWTSKHPWRDMLRVLVAASLPTCVVLKFITVVISVVKRVQPGKQESCSWPGCHDAVFLHLHEVLENPCIF